MDGRVQLPVIAYLRDRFAVEYVDLVTEPGPVAVLSEPNTGPTVQGIYHRVALSLERHRSRGLAVVAHYDCAGNAASPQQQQEQLRTCHDRLRERFPAVPVVALWVDAQWEVRELS
jgi:hypothetical protein